MSKQRYYILKWGNPYTKPKTGPTVKAWGRSRFGAGRDEEMEKAICKRSTPGDGYCLCVSIQSPYRIQSPETVASSRRKRMETSMQKKYPLFADEMITRELETNPDKYSLETATKRQEERKQILDDLEADFQALLAPEKEVKL